LGEELDEELVGGVAEEGIEGLLVGGVEELSDLFDVGGL
jgi:hypothetical protein